MTQIKLNRPNVLCLTGATGAGKDTLTRELVKKGANRVAFGDVLRYRTELHNVLFCHHPIGSLERDDWEREVGFKDLMIQYASSAIIEDPFTFVRPVIDRINNSKPGDGLLVISDMRSEVEYKSLTECDCNLWVAKIVRPDNPHQPKILDNNLNCYGFDKIVNCGTSNFLKTGVEDVCKLLRTTQYRDF